jgi:transposase InsO family protein
MEGFQYTVRYHKGSENIADFLSRQGDFVGAISSNKKRRMREPRKPRVDYKALSKGIKRVKEPDTASTTRSADNQRQQARQKLQIVRPLGQQRRKLSIARPDGTPRTAEINRLLKCQEQDSNIQRLWDISQGRKVYQMTEKERQDAEGLSKVDGVIVKSEVLQGGGTRKRIVTPLCMQEEIVEKIHRQGHAGVTATLNAVKQHHWFRGMKVTVKNVVRRCQDCIKRKGRPLTKEKIAPDQRPRVLGGRWHIDGVILPPSGGYDHIMVATDVATKYVVIKESKGETAEAAKDVLMEVIRRFGRPQEVTTDQGRAFTSSQFSKICEGLFIQYKPTAAGQPQSDGMVERVNRTIEDVLSIACGGDAANWSEHVAEIEYAINTRVSSVTKFSPYELVYGRLPPGPVYTDVLTNDEERAAGETIRNLRNRINALQQIAHENQMRAAGSQRKFHDAHAEAHTFKVGDFVHYYKPSEVERGITTKLAYKWQGPYRVKKVIGDKTFVLEEENGKVLPGTAHARYLYKPPDPKEKGHKSPRRGIRRSTLDQIDGAGDVVN